MVSVGKRMALDQFLFAPAFIPTFMSCLMVLEGNVHEIPSRLKAAWAQAVVSNWGLWIPAQLLNFRLIPITYQVEGPKLQGASIVARSNSTLSSMLFSKKYRFYFQTALVSRGTLFSHFNHLSQSRRPQLRKSS